MAMTIPTYQANEVAPQVSPTVREEASAPIEDFGGGQAAASAADAAGGLIRTTADLYTAQKKQADDAIGQDVYAKLTQKKNDLIYNPQTGAMTKKGQDALDLTNTTSQDFSDYADQVSSTLSNDEQRRQFDHFKRRVGDDLNTTITKYTYGESQNLQAQILGSTVKTAQDDASLNFHEPGKVEDSVGIIKGALTTSMKAQGMPQDVIDQHVNDAISSTYMGVIDRMSANGEDMQAKSYYDSVKDKITNKDNILSIEKTLEAGSMRGESQRQSDKIYDDNDSLTGALEDAIEIKDPKLRDETIKRVKDRFSDDDQAKKADDEQRFNAASQLLEKTKSLDSITPQMMAAMPSEQKRKLEVRFTQLRDGIEPEANSATKYNLQTMAVTPELRDKFLGLNLQEYQHLVTKSELSGLMATQASMRKSDGEADDTIRGLRTKQQVITQTLTPLGISEKDNPEALLKVNRALDDQIAQFSADNKGKKATGKEVQSMLDDLLVNSKDPKAGVFGMFNTGPAYTQDPNAQLSVNVNDIPISEKNQIIKALKQRSIPVTDDKIEELYSRKINGMRQNGR